MDFLNNLKYYVNTRNINKIISASDHLEQLTNKIFFETVLKIPYNSSNNNLYGGNNKDLDSQDIDSQDLEPVITNIKTTCTDTFHFANQLLQEITDIKNQLDKLNINKENENINKIIELLKEIETELKQVNE